MKVLFVTSVYPRWEGDPSASFLVESIRNLREAGCDVTVLAPSYRAIRQQQFQAVRVRRFRYFFRRWENLTHEEGAPTRVKNPFYRFVAMFYIALGTVATYRECRKTPYDIIHVHWPFPHGIFGVVGKRASGAKLVCSFHGAELLLMRRFRYVRPFLQFVLRRCDGVTANSSFTGDQIRSLGLGKAEIIPYGWTVKATPGERRTQTSQPAQKEILYVGRLIERKGVEYLVRAMPRILSGANARLVIVGEGDQRAHISQLVHELGLEDHVEFKGIVSVEVLQELYGRCDVFVLPSIVDTGGDTEGLGVVLIEAMQFCKPVVATRVGGIGDVVLDGQTGLLVPQRDAASLADAVLRVLNEDGLGDRLGAAARTYVEQTFNWQSITQKVMQCYSHSLQVAR